MSGNPSGTLYQTLAKAILLMAGIVLLLWLLYEIRTVVLTLVFAMVLALIINAPVAWLEGKGMKRGWACLLIFVSIFLVLLLLGWLIVPKISEQLKALIANLPQYADQLSRNVSSWFSDYPSLSEQIRKEGNDMSKWMPSVPRTLMRIGNYSVSLLGGLVLLIIFISMIVYAVVNPRPLMEIYYSWFAIKNREKAKEALSYTSAMLIGWFRANLIGGGIEAVLTTFFLSLMQVPGAWVWGGLAFFAELVPKIGFYIMSVPPILVALSVSPATALWVTVFFLALNEVMGDIVMPRLRSSTMNLHPVSTLFMLLAMATAFGFVGALLATPLAAIIKAYYEIFYLLPHGEDKHLEQRINEVIYPSGSPKTK